MNIRPIIKAKYFYKAQQQDSILKNHNKIRILFDILGLDYFNKPEQQINETKYSIEQRSRSLDTTFTIQNSKSNKGKYLKISDDIAYQINSKQNQKKKYN